MRRVLRISLRLLLAAALLAMMGAGVGWWWFHPAHTHTSGVVYAQRHGHDLTLDVIRPEHPNGIGVLAMVSGGWKSAPGKFKPWMAASFLRQGHTVVAVSHLSQPEASIMEIVEDVQKAARHVKDHAKEYGIDPQRLGVIGGSSGGHLSLMLATLGASAADGTPTSAVQAAAVFYPVTDLLNLGPSTENLGDGGPPKSFRKAFGPKGTDLVEWKTIGRDVSPIYHVTPKLPPVFIIHGDADTLVPLEQSQRFKQRAAELGHEVQLLVRPGKGHGWPTMLWDTHLFALWLDDQLTLPAE